MNDTETAIMQVFETYTVAVHEKSVDRFMSLYAPEVRVFDTWGTWSYEGAGAWRRMVERWFSSLGTERVKVTVDDVNVTGGSGLAVVSAIVTYAGISAEGETLRGMQNRLTWALASEGIGWKILHEHTSAPIGFHDAKAILQREA